MHQAWSFSSHATPNPAIFLSPWDDEFLVGWWVLGRLTRCTLRNRTVPLFSIPSSWLPTTSPLSPQPHLTSPSPVSLIGCSCPLPLCTPAPHLLLHPRPLTTLHPGRVCAQAWAVGGLKSGSADAWWHQMGHSSGGPYPRLATLCVWWGQPLACPRSRWCPHPGKGSFSLWGAICSWWVGAVSLGKADWLTHPQRECST